MSYEAWTRQNGSRGSVEYGDTPGTRGHAGDTYGTRHLACPLNLINFFARDTTETRQRHACPNLDTPWDTGGVNERENEYKPGQRLLSL
ncbi:hypothetical protein CsSME_00037631 [Camellia sinensis var. sinensis]